MSANNKSTRNKSYSYIESDHLEPHPHPPSPHVQQQQQQLQKNPKLAPFPEDAFSKGIRFNVKLIGQLEIQRPQSRTEIVAAMRKVRTEFKEKRIKKRSVVLEVSLDGLKTMVSLRRSSRNSSSGNPVEITLFHNPIYRIFYVSHDSRDTKIFSYISRASTSSHFQCIVFKAANRTQAMKIVRSVGQAFEVSHKNVAPSSEFQSDEGTDEKKPLIEKVEPPSSEALPPKLKKDILKLNLSSNLKKSGKEQLESISLPSPTTKKCPDRGFESLLGSSNGSKVAEEKRVIEDQGKRKLKKSYSLEEKDHGHDDEEEEEEEGEEEEDDEEDEEESNTDGQSKGPFHSTYEIHCNKLLQEQLEQQTQSAQHALAQVALLRDQLAAESAARIEAQTRTQQLLIHNKELIEHLQSLVKHIQQLELSLKKKRGDKMAPAAEKESESEEEEEEEQEEDLSSTANPLPKVSNSGRKKVENWLRTTTGNNLNCNGNENSFESGFISLGRHKRSRSRRSLNNLVNSIWKLMKRRSRKRSRWSSLSL